MATPITTRYLEAEDKANIKDMIENGIFKVRPENERKQAQYEAKNRLTHYLKHIPPSLQQAKQAVGMPKLVVDNLLDRTAMLGWGYEDPYGLNEIYDLNHLDVENHFTYLDGYKHGIGFQLVGHGDNTVGEPEQLVTAENPSNVWVRWNGRRRVAAEGIIVRDEEGQGNLSGEYYTASVVVPFNFIGGEVIETEGWAPHGYSRAPIVPFVHNSESGRGLRGHSVITETIMALTETMMEITLGGQVLRALYAAPRMYVLGGKQEMFAGKDAFNMAMDRFAVFGNAVYTDKNGGSQVVQPQVGQFSANDPTALLAWMEDCLTRIAVEGAVPLYNMGITGGIPSNPELIELVNKKGDVRTERAIAQFTRAEVNVGNLLLEGMYGTDAPKDYRPEPVWKPLTRGSLAQSGDWIFKMVSSGVLPSDHSRIYREMNLTRAEIAELKQAATLKSFAQLGEQLTAVPAAPEANAELLPSTEEA